MTSTGDSLHDDDRGAGYGDKLVPEWRVDADDQVVLAGIAVIAAMLLAFGWSVWRSGGGDEDLATVASTVVDEAAPDAERGLDPALAAGTEDVNEGEGEAEDENATGDEEPEAPAAPSTTSSTASTTSTTAVPATGDVQAAVADLAGDVDAVADGSTAVLTGYVASDAERAEAETAALNVEGIETVDNQLVVLVPQVVEALENAGVTAAAATGVGTEITVGGTIDTEDLRQPTLDAAAAVAGVSSVVDDRLEVSVTADLNALPQVRFATGSAVMLDVSNPDLDAAADLLTGVDPETRIEVQGYTDVRGDETANLELSQARADAVRTYLVDAGVDENVLTAVGYGETDQFASGDTREAYQANRLVRFQQVD